MGNCLKRPSSMTWGGEDWGPTDGDDSPITRHYKKKHQKKNETEDEKLLAGNKGVSSTTQVKIRITKQQLEELLGKSDIQGMSIEQVLIQVMDGGGEFQLRHRPWRPALRSIPEVN